MALARWVDIKSEDGKWNIAGHRDRIVRVTDAALAVFAQLYDEQGTPPRRARLPALHAGALQGVLDKLAAYPRRLADLGDDYFSTEMWDETMQQKDGTIHRRTSGDNGFVTDASDWVLSGPHFFLANPFNKTPRRVCTANGHYDPSTWKQSQTTTCLVPTTTPWPTAPNTCGEPPV